MNKKVLFSLALILVSLPALCTAQGPTGSIYGKVVDAQKNPIERANILLYGPSVMGYRRYIVGKTGAFQFLYLLPGECEIRVESPGYKSKILRKIRIETGKSIRLLIEMEASETEQDVAVDVRTPAVDTRSAVWTITLDASLLEHFPRGRDLNDILNTVPTALSEGHPYERTASILGGSGRGQRFGMDGGSVNDAVTNTVIGNLNSDLFDQVEIDLSGRTADSSQAEGASLNIITKRGGNESHASLYYTTTGSGLTRGLYSDDELRSLRVSDPQQDSKYRDFSLSASAPIWEDRAWSYFALRRLGSEQVNPLSPETRMASLGITDSPHFDFEHRETMLFAKLTLRPIDQVRYTGNFLFGHYVEPVYRGSFSDDIAYPATWKLDGENATVTSHQFVYTLDADTQVEARASYASHKVPLIGQTEGYFTFFDDKEKVTWGSAPYNSVSKSSKFTVTAALTHVFQRFLGAQHEVRIGGEFDQGDLHQDWYRSNPYYVFWKDYAASDPYYMGDGLGLLRIVPAPKNSGAWDVQDSTRRFSAFLQDVAAAGRFTLTLGLRFDYSLATQPAQSRPLLSWDARPFLLNPEISDPNILFTTLSDQFSAGKTTSPFGSLTEADKDNAEFLSLSPRFGLVVDPFGNGRTAFKLSAGRSFEPLWIDKYRMSQIFAPGVVDYLWRDLNGNMVMDLMPDDAYTLLSMPPQDPAYMAYSDLKAPYTDEVSAGIEQEIAAGFKVGFRAVWRRTRNLIETVDVANGIDPGARDEKGLIWLPLSVTDPGWDGSLGTADDRQMTVYGLRADRPAPNLVGSNPVGAERTYRAFAFTFEKRMSRNWQVQGSIAWTSFVGNVQADSISANGQTALFDTPNGVLSASAPLAIDRPFQVRILGTYRLPWDIYCSAYFQHYSGAPIVRTLDRVYFPADYMGYGTLNPYAPVVLETLDEKRGPAWTNFDLRLEKDISIASSGRLSLILDVLNLFGEKGQNVDRNPGGTLRYDLNPATYTVSTTYGKTLSVFGVRTFRIGARISF